MGYSLLDANTVAGMAGQKSTPGDGVMTTIMEGPDLTVRTVRTLADIEAVAADWRALEAKSTDALSYFQTYSWCRNWVAHFAGKSSGHQPIIQTAWRGDALVAVWPLMLTGRWGIRKMVALGDPHSQYCNAICDPHHAHADAIRSLLARSLETGGCDVALFRPIPESSPLVAALGDVPRIAGYDNESSILDLSAFGSSDAYVQSLGKLQKRNRNRRRNHLARLGELSFEVIWPDHKDFAPLVALGTQMKRRWLTETGRYSTGFAIKGYEDFLANLSGDRKRLEGACLSVLRAGERVVAVELGFIHKRAYYAYIGGFDWELRELSPGKVQMEMTVCWLIDNGVTAYDLLANPADYKKSWSNTAVRLLGFAAPMSWRGRLYLNAWLPLLPAVKATYTAVSARLRRLMIFGQGVGCLILCM